VKDFVQQMLLTWWIVSTANVDRTLHYDCAAVAGALMLQLSHFTDELDNTECTCFHALTQSV